MDIRRISLIVALGAAGLLLLACDSFGGGEQQVPPIAQPGIPGQPVVPGQPIVPGQPVVPGQPAVPTVPGQPAVPTAPGAPVAPGAPTAPGASPVAEAPPAAPTPPVPTGRPMVDKLNQLKFEKAQDKKETSSLLENQTLPKSKEAQYQVDLPGTPYCHTFIAVGDDNIENLDLKLEDPDGEEVGSDSTEEQSALLDYCAPTPGTYTLKVTMPKGQGEYAIQVFSKGGGPGVQPRFGLGAGDI